MKKVLIVLAIVVLVLAVAGVAAFLYADTRIKAYVEEEAEKRIAARVPQAEGVDVRIDGFPLLFDVAFSSKIDGLHVDVAKVESPRIDAVDLSLDVQGIALDRDTMLNDKKLVVTGIDRATVQGFLTQEAVSKAAKAEVTFGPGTVTAKARGQTFAASLKIGKRQIEFHAPFGAVPPVVVPLPDEDILPCEPEVELLEGKLRMSCTITELPAAVKRAMAQAG